MAFDLSIRHPLHVQRAPEWQEAFDFYRSGRHVLDPKPYEISRGQLTVWRQQTDDTTGQTRRKAYLERVPIHSYLWPSAREYSDDYEDRCSRAVHLPVFRQFVTTYSGAVLRYAPTRSPVTAEDAPPASWGEPWLSYWADVDFRGTRIDAFIRQAIDYSLVFPAGLALTDRPHYPEQALSRAHQMARGERAYSSLITPLELINWFPDCGPLEWIVIEEAMPVRRAPGQAVDKNTPRAQRLVTRQTSQLFGPPEGDDKRSTPIGPQIVHNLGFVPLSVLPARHGGDRRPLMDLESVLGGIVRMDRAVFHHWSQIQEKLDKQTFGQTWIPDEEGAAPGPITIGPSVYNRYNSAHGTPMILSPEATTITSHLQAIDWLLHAARASAQLGRGQAETSESPRSGDATLVEARYEAQALVEIAEAAERFDRELHRHVAAFEGQDKYPQASYDRELSMRALDRQLAAALQLKALGVPAETLSEVLRPIVEAYMLEQGQSTEAIKRATDALMNLEVMSEAPAPQGAPTTAGIVAD